LIYDESVDLEDEIELLGDELGRPYVIKDGGVFPILISEIRGNQRPGYTGSSSGAT
jgi:hypothetical protein